MPMGAGAPRPVQVIPRSRLAVLVAPILCAVIALGFVPVASAAQPPTPSTTPLQPDVSLSVEAVIAAARAYLGVPYHVGTEGPSSFDCSGLVYRAFMDAGQGARIGGNRLRAAGYLRWFAGLGRLVTDESLAARGDLVIYANGEHVGIYLGDGRVISALVTGVAVHSLDGITLPVTGFLKVDWSGNGASPGSGPRFSPTDVSEVPVALAPPLLWTPPLADKAATVVDGHERADMRTANSRTYQRSDGRFTTEFFAHPINYLPANSTPWQPIDLHFKALAKGAGALASGSPVSLTLSAANNANGFLQVSAGASTIRLQRVQAASQTLPGAMPVISADGLSVDYFNFLPEGVGLRVVATADGFKSFLALPKEPKTNRFAFAVDAPGLTPMLQADGSIAFLDATGAVVGRMPVPLLLDSSDVDGSGGGLFSAAVTLGVDTTGALPQITITVGRDYLDEAVYPAYIDPTLVDFPAASARANETFVSSRYPNANFNAYQRPEAPGYHEMWQGRLPGTSNDSAAYLRFDGVAAALGGASVSSASLQLYPYWQFSHDQARPTWVNRVTSTWDASTLTWAAQPIADAPLGQIDTSQGQTADFDATAYVASVLAALDTDYGLQLGADGTGQGNWKRILDAPGFEPRLVVNWSGLAPRGADIAAGQSSAAATLAWTQPGLAPATLRYQVQVSPDGFASIALDSGIVRGKAGKTSSFALAVGSLLPIDYEWRVRTRYVDGTWSGWSTPAALTYAPAPAPTTHGATVRDR